MSGKSCTASLVVGDVKAGKYLSLKFEDESDNLTGRSRTPDRTDPLGKVRRGVDELRSGYALASVVQPRSFSPD